MSFYCVRVSVVCWGRGMSSESLSEHERLALAAIIQYYLIRNKKKGTSVSQTILAGKVGLNAQTVNNFLFAASNEGALALKNYFEPLVRGDCDWFSDPPEHIKSAIDSVYHESVKKDSDSLNNVLLRTRHTDQQYHNELGEYYSGLWDIIRYSAHDADQYSTSGETDPWVVRAAMEVSPTDVRHGLKEPRFVIHYRPKDDELRKSTGAITLINNGQHFCIMGREHDTGAPVFVIAQFFHTRRNRFPGLVFRRHSTGRMFTSRVSFVRSKAKTIQELEEKINVFRESQLRERFGIDIDDLDRCLREAVNDIPNSGKFALLLR